MRRYHRGRGRGKARRWTWVLALLLWAARPAEAQDGDESSAAPQIDWSAASEEAADLLSRYIRVNTTNPPGREIVGARFLRDQLISEGIEFLLIDQGEGAGGGKAALVGRIRAGREPREGAIVLLSHMDVVAASPEFWSVDPLAGEIRDGYIWGRGALDMKGTAIAQLMALKLLARHGPPLSRDIILLATSDEEIVGGIDAGDFLQDHADLLKGAEFVINEGGTIRVDANDDVLYYGVGVTEKSPFWQSVTARGPSGHGSQPIAASALNRLIEGLERLRSWDTPIQLTPPVAEFFRRLALVAPPAEAELYADIEGSLADPEKRALILRDRYHNAILRNTISITALEGSPRTNVIPPMASAELDVRLLPGADPDSFLAELRERAGADGETLTIEPLGQNWPATASPSDSELFRAIESLAEEFDPGATVLPYVLAGFTDSHYFREMGIEAYGLGLFKLPVSESERVHGVDERLSLQNLGFGTQFLYELLVRVGT